MTPAPIRPDELVIHDTAPIVDGSSARESLRRSIELAQLGDRLGYKRYWAAELHGMRATASCAPAVLAGIIASRTSRIRVGAGGVLLPYHSPLVVSEQFGTLEAIHPGRIDLALGRGAGAPKAARDAVIGPRGRWDATDEEFERSITELRCYFHDEIHDTVRSVPGYDNEPQLWMLGRSGESAGIAVRQRLPYAFSGFYNRDGSDDVAATYLAAGANLDGHRDAGDTGARGGRDCWAPHLGAWVAVIAADDADQADYLAGSYRLKHTLSKASGRKTYLADPAVAAAQRPVSGDAARVFDEATAGFIIGDADTVRRELAVFRDRHGLHELIIRTPIYDHAAKQRSLTLIAGATS